jgi:hypothetical protein
VNGAAISSSGVVLPEPELPITLLLSLLNGEIHVVQCGFVSVGENRKETCRENQVMLKM